MAESCSEKDLEVLEKIGIYDSDSETVDLDKVVVVCEAVKEVFSGCCGEKEELSTPEVALLYIVSESCVKFLLSDRDVYNACAKGLGREL